MVAYSFQKMFAPQVEGLTKLQTVRAQRKRHARVGEAVQLYTAMRTKYCRKLVTPDPVCFWLDDIRLEITPETIAGIEINGHELSDAEIETFAIADGFSPARLATPEHGWIWKPDTSARQLMALFWEAAHGLGPWQGVVIHWQPE